MHAATSPAAVHASHDRRVLEAARASMNLEIQQMYRRLVARRRRRSSSPPTLPIPALDHRSLARCQRWPATQPALKGSPAHKQRQQPGGVCGVLSHSDSSSTWCCCCSSQLRSRARYVRRDAAVTEYATAPISTFLLKSQLSCCTPCKLTTTAACIMHRPAAFALTATRASIVTSASVRSARRGRASLLRTTTSDPRRSSALGAVGAIETPAAASAIRASWATRATVCAWAVPRTTTATATVAA